MKKIKYILIAWLMPGLALADTIRNPLGTVTNIDQVYINVINAILGIVGGLTFIVFIYNGFRFILALGNEEVLGKAKKGIFWSLAGLLVILLAYTIVKYVFSSLGFTIN